MGRRVDSHPSVDVTYADRLNALYGALWRAGVTADVVHPSADLGGYRLVLVPTLYLVRDADVEALHRYVEGGGTAAVTYFSGIVDPDDHIRLGGYPGAFRELLGVRTEEFFPCARASRSTSTTAAPPTCGPSGCTRRRGGARVVHRWPLPGVPALTRRSVGDGAAWYVGTRLDEPATDRLVARLLAEAGVRPAAPAPSGVEVVRRRADEQSWLFVINHTDAEVRLPAHGDELLTGARCAGELILPAGEVAVVREDRT
ncbi:beta-galactosidase trimerization domain-containing protein [Micromonospora sp. M12]